MSKTSKILDSFLVISYQRGNKKALEILVKRWNKRLCIQAYRYTKDWDLAKDVVQDTWHTVITKLFLLRDAASFGSWAMTITSRKALDLIRKNSKTRKIYESHVLVNNEVETSPIQTQEEQIGEILKMIPELPFDQQMVLKLFYLEEYSLKQISDITGVSINTVKTRLFRAREKLKSIIKNKEDEKRD
ncbi:RNA polymerase sigma factor [Flagellimonas meridianipacifica]|uniref:RNA polymerase sigma-70 factor (ECF subfamily) n=1 Tax=Flagellimonas meridianipacifica TaxID=1080225 RepID=A0A2T0MDG0_9FLAO|nr:sigma-70 family RNA polymerase sigma factor [Allomuricauda pacifica]PRX55522.1 RNA polymerase sigma-70 factor (ECF subfamily) [Allomuricauda pacifica]